MNYLELFNKTMLELNYRTLNELSAIYKSEHLRILENLKRVNAEVCSSVPWDFLDPKEAPNCFAKGIDGGLKTNFEAPDDTSLIPDPWAQDVLVYGAALKTKANPAHPKFAFWNASYIRALARLRSECRTEEDKGPHISVKHPRRV